MTAVMRSGGERWVAVGSRIKRGPVGLVLMASLALGAIPARGQAPDEAWRTIRTEHFRVSFPERLEPLARHAADRAEWSYDVLSEHFVQQPEGTIDLVVTDHTDLSNGFAQVVPSNRITVFARPPTDSPSLGYFDDWMELVILHELAHTFHLDLTRNPLGRAARAVFGRLEAEWPVFPSLGVPRWVIEGLATWYESRYTGSGRVRGSYQEMQLRTATIEGRFEDIGQASGESPLWPTGNRSYAYGAQFFAYLLERHGEESMVAFVEAVAGQWIPYRIDAAGRDAFGVSLSDEWRAWTDSLEERYAGLDRELARFGPVTASERLTRDARWGWHPSVSPDGDRLVYVRADSRSDTQLRVDDPAGGADRQLARVNGLPTYSWLPGGRLLVAQLERHGPYRTYGDLYVLGADGDTERRLTDGARLSDPSVGPEGDWAVAVQQGDGTTSIVLVDLSTGELTPFVPPDPEVHWAFPRVSPDGRWIVATRWVPDSYSDIVLLDGRTGRIVTRVTRDRAIDVAPSWTADSRWIVWSSDRTGISNIYGWEVDPAQGPAPQPVMLTNVRTGATFPSVDPSGSWLYFTAYHVDGWDVERTPFRPAESPPAPALDPRFESPVPPRERGIATEPMEAYSPWPTLWPQYWEPSVSDPISFPGLSTTSGTIPAGEALGWSVGAQTTGRDVAGRHSYSLVGRVFTGSGDVEGGFAYGYRGLGNPVLTVGATQFYGSGGQLLAGDPAEPLYVIERERAVTGSVTLSAPRYRYDLATTVRGALVWEQRELLDRSFDRTDAFRLARPSSRYAEAALGASFGTLRTHSFQMGIARGVGVSVTGRVRDELGVPDSLRSVRARDRSLVDVVGRVRGAIPLWSTGRVTHVLALQASGGIAQGPGAGPDHFDVGGASGRPEDISGAELFGGSPIFFAVRGHARNTRFGRYAWTASAEYRFPIAMVNYGLGAWPLHLDRMIGSLFFDVGNAWGPDSWPTGIGNLRRSAIAAAGAEVTWQLLLFYDSELRVRGGFGVPFDGSGSRGWVRVGLPF